MEGAITRERESKTASEIICIPAAEQPAGSLHRRPYILIRNTAVALIIHPQKDTQTHKMLEGVHVQ